jgi:ketosteroid isomerase-like protein
MSTESENVALLKDAYQRWQDTKAGSVDHWLDLMTDDVQFRSLAAGAIEMRFTRPSSCKGEVKHNFAGLTSEWEMNYYRVVALAQVSCKHKKTANSLLPPKADFHRFREGKICEFFEISDTANALAPATPEFRRMERRTR